MSDETQMGREECERVLEEWAYDPATRALADALRASLAREKAARDAALEECAQRLIGLEQDAWEDGEPEEAGGIMRALKAVRALKSRGAPWESAPPHGDKERGTE
jgi:hypothetical protein